MNRVRGLFLVISVLAIAVAVVACGGDDDEDSADAENGSNSEATITEAPDDESSADDDPTEPADEATEPPDDGDGGSVEASDACAVLTQSEVEDAFGVAMLEPEFIPLPDTPIPGGGTATTGSCAYVSETTADSLSLTVYSADESGAEALVSLACEGKESVAVGDTACWYTEAHQQIQMKAGPNFVDLFVTTVDGDSTQITSTLAEQAAARLR